MLMLRQRRMSLPVTDQLVRCEPPCETDACVPTYAPHAGQGTWARRTAMTAHLQSAELTNSQEAQRLAALRRYDILDTPPDGSFDRVTAMAARLFSVPIS